MLGRTEQPLSVALRALAIDRIDRAGTVSCSSLHPEKRRQRLCELGTFRTHASNQRDGLRVILARSVFAQGDATEEIVRPCVTVRP